MVKRNGSVRNVQKNMQFNQIGKLILRPVELESTNVTVAHCFPGKIASSHTELSVML
jgi:hypothetical protein